MSDGNLAFSLRIPSGDGSLIRINAYDDLGWDSAGRVKLTVEVTHRHKTIFHRGKLRCALHSASDSNRAKALVLELVAMKPGDTDADYFSEYSPEQLAWAAQYSDLITSVRYDRYDDI